MTGLKQNVSAPSAYEELARREHANLDIFWLKEDSLEDPADLPTPGRISGRNH